MKMLEIKFPFIDGTNLIEAEKEEFSQGENIIVTNGQFSELAAVLKIVSHDKIKNTSDENEWKLVRSATENDIEKYNKIQAKNNDYLGVCNEKIKKHGLSLMKLVDVKTSFDEKKLTFYFSAEGRVDFRELVSDLVKTFKKVIRLQQIGSRDEAKILGGVGKCGRQLCCASFLKRIESITLDDAKEQGISFGVNKLSGACGKLTCCLLYELEEYKKLSKNMPMIGDNVKVKKINCRVIGRNILKQTIMIENENGQREEVEL